MNIVLFFISNIIKLFKGNLILIYEGIRMFMVYIMRLPKEMYYDKYLLEKKKERVTFEIKIKKDLVDDYNKDFTKLCDQIDSIGNFGESGELDFKYKIPIMCILRLIFLYASYTQNGRNVAISYWLFGLFLPYFFFNSLSYCFVYVKSAVIGSLISFGILYGTYTSLIQLADSIPVFGFLKYLEYLNFEIEVTNYFVLAWLVIDHILSFISLYWNPVHVYPVKKIKAKRILTAIVFEFFNSKIHMMSMLFFLKGLKLNVLFFMIDLIGGLTSYIWKNEISAWVSVIFHEHRMAHICKVYQDSHKFHHIMHDATPFNANGHGCGGPEDMSLSIFHMIVSSFIQRGLISPLSPTMVIVDIINKMYDHVRFEDEYNNSNYHADHHTYHNKNFSRFGIDLLYGCSVKKDYIWDEDDYEIFKKEDTDFYVLEYKPMEAKKK